MSSRRSRQSSASRISDDQIIELVSKLRQLVPEIRHRRPDKVLKYISILKISNTRKWQGLLYKHVSNNLVETTKYAYPILYSIPLIPCEGVAHFKLLT